MGPIIRFATLDDAKAIQGIYAPFCGGHSPVSFETMPPSVQEMGSRIERILQKYPWLVCQVDGQVVGYVYGSSHRERAAYQWCTEVTAYIDSTHRRAGLGRAMYTSLFQILAAQGFINAYAGITLPNPASVALHAKMGFELVGIYKGIGFKCGAWQDVGWWRLLLMAPPANPQPPRTWRDLPPSVVDQAIQAGIDLLK